MNLLFAHDHRFVRGRDDAVFSQGSFPARVWQRYLDHFDTIRVVARDDGVQPGPGLARSDRDRVHFALVPSPSLVSRLGWRAGALYSRLDHEVAAADAVVARLPSDIGLLAAHLAQARGKPLLVEVVGCAFDGYGNQGSFLARLYAPLARLRMRRAVTNSDYALYVTERWLQGRYPASHGHVGFASNVILEASGPEVATNREKRLAELSRGRPAVLGTIASLRTASKGLQTMMAALAAIKQAGRPVPEWRILGPGETGQWRTLAERLGIAEHVAFDGSLAAGPRVLDWLDAIDIHCQPSFQEGLPRATVEAMSRGCACLGSTAGGLPELLPSVRTHPPGDVARLTTLLTDYLDDPDAIAAASRADMVRARDFQKGAIEGRRAKLFSDFAVVARRKAAARSELATPDIL